ncbi:hypothetical protein GGR52DRAFT_570258 [Hypoxylon sp. FL1284]|nr:hypothetical protein GGR52DRAFT_570258 [Hypoxylon sp. FL1284]
MSPTYTMSAHLCKQIQKSFQTRNTSPEPQNSAPQNSAPVTTTYLPTFRRSPSPSELGLEMGRSLKEQFEESRRKGE